MTTIARYLLLASALAACGLPEKDHCATDTDCLGGEVCRAGTCQAPVGDECGTTGVRCGPDASCSSTADGLACTCNPGFAGDGASCADVDECAAASAPCAAHAACSNQPGSHTCTCQTGFTGDGDTYCVPDRFTKVAAAGGFSCGLAGDGGIYCWGNNAFGSVGDGTIAPRARPIQVGTANDWIDVGARTNMACGIRADHSMWCWGLGTTGQLGNGGTTSSYTPVQVVSDKPGVGWKAIAAGRQQVCGLHTDGSAACWGLDRISSQSLGFPIAVSPDTDWTVLATGTVRCGIRGNPGPLYCWGKSTSGDLGLGATTTQLAPAQVGSALWRTVAVGYDNACGIRADGALLCWGTSPLTGSALKYGNTPVQVGAASDWEAISLSVTGAVGLRAGGHAYVWGTNENAQLGVPVTTAEVVDPTPLSGDVATWSQISSGNVHGCGITGGQLYCWGTISDGFLGTGAATALLRPARIGGDTWTALAGDGTRQCGIRSDGALLCRGHDDVRGVGFGDTDPVWTPTRLGTDTWTMVTGSSAIQQWVAICAIRGGAPYCWGDNSTGELGIGNTDGPQLRPVPVKLPPGMQWTEIAVADHSCAVSSEGLLYCWGANDTGQLGAGVTSDTPTTAPGVPVPGTWLHVAVMRHGLSAAMTCGIKANHTLWCWGQEPPPTTTRHLTPTQVGVSDTWLALSMGVPRNNNLGNRGTICAIKADHTLWCWGSDPGNGAPDPVSVPVQVGSSADWKTVAVGREICAVKAGGTLWCWGNNDVLGDGSPIDYSNDASVTRPTQIGGDTDWSALTMSGRTCATKTDGSMWCWGFGAAASPDFFTVPVAVR